MSKNNRELKSIFKETFNIKTNEIYLSLIVFLYIVISNLLSGINLKVLSIVFLIQTFLLLLENYITISVYSGIKKIIKNQIIISKDIFIDGLYFFLRVLLYKIFVCISFALLFAIAFGIIEVIKKIPVVNAAILTIITLLWLSIPVYYILLTFFAPFVIILEDRPVLDSMKISFNFVKENLDAFVIITFLFGILWGICILFFKKYNNLKGIEILFFYIFGLLEILTIKTFMILYNKIKVVSKT